MQTIERSKIAKELEAFCDKYETYGAAAKALGITLAQLSTARNDEDTVIPAKALAKLGYGYTSVYVRKADMPTKARKPKRAAKKPTAKKAAKPARKKPAKPKAKAPKAAPKKATKTKTKTKTKKPAEKKAADKPTPAATPTPAAPKPQRAPKVDVTAPPIKKDPPAATPPVQVVNVTAPSDGTFN